MNYTKEQLSAPLGETFYKGNLEGVKQGEWQKYRIVKVVKGEETYYKIHNTMTSGCISFLPKILGGFGFFGMYSEVFWCEWDGEKTIYDSYEEAVQVIESAIKWVEDIQERCKQSNLPSVESIVSWHPEEEEL